MPYTVAQLIKQLQKLDSNQDSEVWLASDEEGNNFHPFAAYGIAYSNEVDQDSSGNEEVVILWP